jgi:hypothetical protein
MNWLIKIPKRSCLICGSNIYSRENLNIGEIEMERKLEEIRADYKHHAAEVGHRARLLKRITQEVQFHEAKMEQFAQEEQALGGRPSVAPAPVAAPAEEAKESAS